MGVGYGVKTYLDDEALGVSGEEPDLFRDRDLRAEGDQDHDRDQEHETVGEIEKRRAESPSDGTGALVYCICGIELNQSKL